MNKKRTLSLFGEILGIMEKLRSENGCPWDKEQDHESIKSYIIEEAYEVLESIEEKNFENLKAELGDLLFQIIFHAQMAKESNLFDINDVLSDIINKMKERHPHVFGDTKVSDSKDVLANWNKIKRVKNEDKSILKSIPHNLPALLWAKRIQERVSTVGFDWQNIDDVMRKIKEEIRELEKEYKTQEKMKIEEEFGDLLFSLVNISRFLKIDPELSLRKSIHKFIKRFSLMEKKIKDKGKRLEELTLKELDKFWNELK